MKVKQKKTFNHPRFPNSILSNLEVMSEYDIITEVNGKEVKTLEDYRKQMKKSISIKGSKYIEIISEVNKRVVLKISELEEEKIFSETYKYNLGILYDL